MAPAATSPAKVQVAVGANPPVAAAAVGAEAAVGAQPKPAVPSWNELLLTSTKNDMSCEDYIDALKRDVDARLQVWLTQPPAIGGIGLKLGGGIAVYQCLGNDDLQCPVSGFADDDCSIGWSERPTR